MTDKVQKIREEVERLKRWNNNVRNSTRHMTLQEEDFNRGKHSSYLEILNFIDSLQEESVSEELEDAAKNHAVERYKATRDMVLAEKCKWSFKAGAEWKEEQMMAKAVDACCFGFQDAALFSFRLPADKYLVGSKVKVIVIEEG